MGFRKGEGLGRKEKEREDERMRGREDERRRGKKARYGRSRKTRLMHNSRQVSHQHCQVGESRTISLGREHAMVDHGQKSNSNGTGLMH
jgi:hypothetical protein